MTKRMTIEQRAAEARAKAQSLEDRAAEVRARGDNEVYRKVEQSMRHALWISELDGLDDETKSTATRLAGRLDIYLARLRSPYRPRVNQNEPVQTTITGEKEIVR